MLIASSLVPAVVPQTAAAPMLRAGAPEALRINVGSAVAPVLGDLQLEQDLVAVEISGSHEAVSLDGPVPQPHGRLPRLGPVLAGGYRQRREAAKRHTRAEQIALLEHTQLRQLRLKVHRHRGVGERVIFGKRCLQRVGFRKFALVP